MCDKHAYRRMSSASLSSLTNSPLMASNHFHHDQLLHDSHHQSFTQRQAGSHTNMTSQDDHRFSLPNLSSAHNVSVLETLMSIDPSGNIPTPPTSQQETNAEASKTIKRPKITHRSRFKHRFMVESAWRKGGQMTSRHITPDQGVVTCLHLTPKYIVLSMDTARIHVFDVEGNHLRVLAGHLMGVWAMVPWDDILVSGGCDRDVRVWNMATG